MGFDIAVIGLGVMGKHHTRVCSELGILNSVCDVRSENCNLITQKYGVASYGDVDSLLKSTDITTAIIIATPTPTHFDIAKKCLLAGRHILLEKPISLSLQEAEELKTLQKENQVIAIGYIEMFNPAFQLIKALIEDSAFGKITSVNIKRVGGIPRSADNVILDLMTHDLGLLINLFEKSPSSFKVYQHKNLDDQIIDSAQALLNFDSASASCEANWISPVKIRQMAVTGTNLYCEADLIKQVVTEVWKPDGLLAQKTYFSKVVDSYTDGYLSTTIPLKAEPLKAEIKSFLDFINGDKESKIISISEGIEILRLTLKVMEAANDN